MILLTGATGTAGSFIANEFVRERVPVRILVRNRAKAAGLEKVPTVEIVEGDMSRRGTLGAALDGVDRVLMISAPLMDIVETQNTFMTLPRPQASATLSNSLAWTLGLIPHFPLVSCTWKSRNILKNRPRVDPAASTGFMQEYLREAPSIIHDGAFYLALADVKLNPIDLVDVGKIGFLLLRDGGHEGERIPITGPEALTMAEIADRISRAVGKTVRYVPVSPIQRRQALIAHGVPQQIADALDRQVEERLKGGIELQVDLSTHQLFNVKPTTFLEFAQRNAEAFGGSRSRDGTQ